MKADKDKRVVLITGCGSSLGKELIGAYAKCKDTIVVGLTRRSKCYEIKKRQRSLIKPNVYIFGVDYSSFEDIRTRVSEIIYRFEKIDILVNNTGMSVKVKVDSILGFDIHKAVQANFCVPLCVCKSVLPYMLSRDKGKIINILPNNRLSKEQESGLFSTNKNILDNFSMNLRRELTKTRIKVKAMKPCSIFKNKMDQVKWANSLAQSYDTELYKDKVLDFLKRKFNPEQQIVYRDKTQ